MVGIGTLISGGTNIMELLLLFLLLIFFFFFFFYQKNDWALLSSYESNGQTDGKLLCAPEIP